MTFIDDATGGGLEINSFEDLKHHQGKTLVGFIHVGPRAEIVDFRITVGKTFFPFGE